MPELDPTRIVVTLDSAWAPEFVIEDVFSVISQWGVPTTCFLTESVACQAPVATEIGVYLNVLPGSTQGGTKSDIVSNLRNMFPHAVSMRSHGLYWDHELAALLKEAGFRFDSSIKGLFENNLAPTTERDLVRVPYWWSDVFHLKTEMPLSCKSLGSKLSTPGLKVFKFHMMYIWLNCNSQKDWLRVRAAVGANLQGASRVLLSRYRQDGQGIGTYFFELLQWMASFGRVNKTICKIRQYADHHG